MLEQTRTLLGSTAVGDALLALKALRVHLDLDARTHPPPGSPKRWQRPQQHELLRVVNNSRREHGQACSSC